MRALRPLSVFHTKNPINSGARQPAAPAYVDSRMILPYGVASPVRISPIAWGD